MKLRTARTAVWSLMGAVVFIGLIALVTGSPAAIALMAAAAAAEMLVFFLFVKCPRCGRRLDRAGMKPDIAYCPFCGEALEDR